jgi:hypothetical protein
MRGADIDTDVDATMLAPSAGRGVLNGWDSIDSASPNGTTSTTTIAARINTRYRFRNRFRISCSHRGSLGESSRSHPTTSSGVPSSPVSDCKGTADREKSNVPCVLREISVRCHHRERRPTSDPASGKCGTTFHKISSDREDVSRVPGIRPGSLLSSEALWPEDIGGSSEDKETDMEEPGVPDLQDSGSQTSRGRPCPERRVT